jgi:hypothetical protein
VIRTVAVLAAAAALIAPAAASATIVPQKGIAGASLDMTQAQVQAKLGDPDSKKTQTSPILGKYFTWFYAKTSIDMFRTGSRRVFNLSTTSRAQKTSTGVGVGSTAAAVKKGVKNAKCDKSHCWVGNFTGGEKVTDFPLSKSGRVTRVTIGYVID